MAVKKPGRALCANPAFFLRSDSGKIFTKLAMMVLKIADEHHRLTDDPWSVDLLIHSGEQSHYFIQSRFLKQVVLVSTFNKQEMNFQPRCDYTCLVGEVDA